MSCNKTIVKSNQSNINFRILWVIIMNTINYGEYLC
jgi:hypothetical protein